MLMFILGFAAGWLLFKRPELVNKLFIKIAEKANTGIFKF